MARYVIPGAFGISRRTFAELDDLIRALRVGSREFNSVMDTAAELMAHTTQGFALKMMSGGQYPGPSHFEIPVRMITGRTRAGWRVKRVARMSWETYNEERGAWMIEHGVVRGGGGTRRPILRNAGVETLRFVGYTRFGQRLMKETWGDLRNNKGQFRAFQHRIRPFMLMYAGRAPMAGPTGRLPR